MISATLGPIVAVSDKLLSVPGRLESGFATNQIGDGKSVEMPHEGLDAVGQDMPQTTNRGDDAAVAGLVETFDKVSGIFETADDLADIDCVGWLIQQQSAAATPDAVNKTLRDQSLGNLHHMIFRDAILPSDFGDRVMTVIGGQIH
jgi:hypothetical protein